MTASGKEPAAVKEKCFLISRKWQEARMVYTNGEENDKQEKRKRCNQSMKLRALKTNSTYFITVMLFKEKPLQLMAHWISTRFLVPILLKTCLGCKK